MSDAASLPFRTRWLRASRPRSTTMIEISVFAAIVGFLLLASMYSNSVLVTRLHAFDAIELAFAPRVTISEFLAVNGTWPGPDVVGGSVEPGWQREPVVSARIREGGAIDISFGARGFPPFAGKVLTFRAWQAGSTEQPLLWTCGRAVPAAGMAAADDRTSVSDHSLPSFCRLRR